MAENTDVIQMNEHGCYYLTLETVDQVDIFVRPVYKQIIVHTLNHFIENKGFIVYAWCLNSNSLHLICQAQVNMLLGEIRKGFKQFTTDKIIEAIKAEPDERKNWILEHFEKHTGFFGNHLQTQFWKVVKDPVQIDMKRPETMAETIDLIHNIPVKNRVVQYPEDYIYSSARDYESSPGLVKTTRLAVVEQELDSIHNMKTSFKKARRN